jgi:hypothetical protein
MIKPALSPDILEWLDELYESLFEREYGYFRPVVNDFVEKYLDCGNPRCGFARIRCPSCRAEHLLTFSCETGGVVPPIMLKGLRNVGRGCR